MYLREIKYGRWLRIKYLVNVCLEIEGKKREQGKNQTCQKITRQESIRIKQTLQLSPDVCSPRAVHSFSEQTFSSVL